jgi:hypothetical protein
MAAVTVTWFKPSKKGPGCGYPRVSVGKRSLDFNAEAVELLGMPSAVKIGVTSDGKLAVSPADENDAEACRLTYRGWKKTYAVINRPRLARMLASHGITGRHRLARSGEPGLFVGEPAN